METLLCNVIPLCAFRPGCPLILDVKCLGTKTLNGSFRHCVKPDRRRSVSVNRIQDIPERDCIGYGDQKEGHFITVHVCYPPFVSKTVDTINHYMIGDKMLESITTTTTNTDTSVSTDTATYTVAYYNYNKIECEKYDGTGYQCRNDGVYVICPICEGSGMMERKEKCVPCCPPCNPWYPIPWDPPATYDTFPPQKYIITC